MLPRKPVTERQIDTDQQLQALLKQGWRRDELLAGHPGEPYWHSLPDELKQEWQKQVDQYRRDDDLDGPCFWFDPQSRQCRHHTFRPQVCRAFEIGGNICRQWRKHYRDLIDD